MEQGVCFIKFRAHTKLRGITSILEAMIIIQKALKKTEKLSESYSSLTNEYNVLHNTGILICTNSGQKFSKALTVRHSTKQHLMATIYHKTNVRQLWSYS